MYRLAVVAACIAFVNGFPTFETTLDEHWEQFKQEHNKVYADKYEEAKRRMIWEDNLAYIQNHNIDYDLGQRDYFLGMNEFTDWSHAEFKSYMNNYNHDNHTHIETEFRLELVRPSAMVDWRQHDCVTPVKNQGACGSCWAFSSIGSLEGVHAKMTGKLVSLSEQQLVDCAGDKYGNNACFGGSPYMALKYVAENGGVDTEESYSYKAVAGSCHFSKADVGATCSGVAAVQSGDENALAQAVSSVGPVSVAIDASHRSFQSYRGGIYNEPACSSTKLDHGVLVVGYQSGYWIVKNSWGKGWGQAGYIHMSRDRDNQCGIATAAVYPKM